MPVAFTCRAPAGAVWSRYLATRARQILRALAVRSELSLSLVADPEMHALNRAHRGKDRPTDVLAFAQGEGDGGAPEGLLGDVVISVDTARRQARTARHPLGREAERLLVHGLLHLLGYDHERSAREAARMKRKERELAGWLR